jgi:hypothetical protein
MLNPEQLFMGQYMPLYKWKFKAISSSFVNLFHRQQLIQQVFLPSFNHIVMAFGHDPQRGEEIDEMILKLLWTRKR